MNRGVGVGFALLVLLAALYAFSPRTAPAVPAKGISLDTVLLLDAAQVGSRIVAIGERGVIVISQDGGKTWRQTSSPTQVTLTSVYFHDAQLGWAVGHDSVILKTTDGGTTWHQVYSAPEQQKPLLKVWFSNARNGYAIGAYGLYLRTQDGGGAWQPQKIMDADLHLNALAALSEGQLLIAGEAGLLLRSLDHGQTWQRLASPYKGSFFGLLATADNGVLAYGLRGHVFRSTDAGETWEAIPTGSQATLMAGAVLADNSILLAGQNGTVLVSHSRGKTFALQKHPSQKHVAAILADGNHALLFGDTGVARFESR